MRFNPAVATKNVNELDPSIEHRRTLRLRMLRTQEKSDRFTDYLVAEEEVKRLIMKYLLGLGFVLFIVLVI